jgi:hypothetical protein
MSVVAGWYADPTVPGRVRWWDGTAWTATTASSPEPASAAVPSPAPYGAADPDRWSPVHVVVPAERTMATRALVWGVLSVPLFVAFPVPLLALVFGIVGLARARRLAFEGHEPAGRRRSIAGIVLGGLGFLLLIALVVWAGLAA